MRQPPPAYCNQDGTIAATELWRPDGSWATLRNGQARQAGPINIPDTVEIAPAPCGPDARQTAAPTKSPVGAASSPQLERRSSC
ncbi:hypothetical protein GCM10009738_14540 [Kitasatospora viridis]